MDTVINRLSEIEEAAGAIADEANVRKKRLPKRWKTRQPLLIRILNRKQPAG